MKQDKLDRKRLIRSRNRSDKLGSGGAQAKCKRAQKEKSSSQGRVARMEKPLSELAKNCKEVPVDDIQAYVNRPIEVRLKEVAEGKEPGKIKRPMNSFMLYRKAYQHITKYWCEKNNHQVVSQVCGDSWPLEPDSVKRQFSDWAQIERHNHQSAHPGYKFSPSKPGTVKVSKRRSSTNLITDDSDSEDRSFKDFPPKRQRGTNENETTHDFDTPHFSHGSLRQHIPSPRSINSMTQQNPQRICYQESNQCKQLPSSLEFDEARQGEHYHQNISHSHAPAEAQNIYWTRLAAAERFFSGIQGRGFDENGYMEFSDPNTACSLSGPIHHQPMINLNQMYLTSSYLTDHFSHNGYYEGQECPSKNSFWQPQIDFQNESTSIVDPGFNSESYHSRNHPSHLFRGQSDEFLREDFPKWSPKK